ncbi:hypothetical protein EVAR_19398_1 [Eumeta japonica]|uniref:Uncharacterized protein n=1 Tax=Eumeta variegata TaxID=151549 RepID=A0A4C1TRJ0_EUMVA|nr:hypothetical protein EVAR_19398_1 [Eumeta japonica]
MLLQVRSNKNKLLKKTEPCHLDVWCLRLKGKSSTSRLLLRSSFYSNRGARTLSLPAGPGRGGGFLRQSSATRWQHPGPEARSEWFNMTQVKNLSVNSPTIRMDIDLAHTRPAPARVEADTARHGHGLITEIYVNKRSLTIVRKLHRSLRSRKFIDRYPPQPVVEKHPTESTLKRTREPAGEAALLESVSLTASKTELMDRAISAITHIATEDRSELNKNVIRDISTWGQEFLAVVAHLDLRLTKT